MADVIQQQEEIASAGGLVVVVSFGLQEGALRWLQDTGCPFTMLLDSDRKIYHSFGLQRSVLKVWGVSSLVYYAEAMYAGKPLPKPYENVHDDTQQMGGDFILGPDGTVKFMYPSQTNTDRPNIDLILQELKKIKNA